LVAISPNVGKMAVAPEAIWDCAALTRSPAARPLLFLGLDPMVEAV
jgi:hypothetical protein